ncbi:hypothetical protein QAD02_020557 [Eretmocerus hayati]|uniref:Uncharacterized protein n=1 Tax=Eretmocerus hayati TaxID=131215 RepID=A0ACC2PN94_9HYME|nr:hypothetical protein QAD02_020557 [Eretmocerus hayati]
MDNIEPINELIPAGSADEARFRINELLLNYMRDHENFAQRKVPELSVCGREKFAQMWIYVCSALNQIGGSYYNKEPSQWRKYWDEIRLKAKDQLSEYFGNIGKTGNKHVEEPDEYIWHVAFIYGYVGLGLNIGTESGLDPEDKGCVSLN